MKTPMPDDERQQLEHLRQVHIRRLRELEMRAATEGIYTPPQVCTEIEDIRAIIIDLDRQLSPAAPRLLRHAVADFVGRSQEIDHLSAILGHPAQGVAPIACIRGMGGIGKTELAHMTIQQIASAFPDGQVLIELRGTSSDPQSPTQAIQKVLRTFKREAKLPDDLEELKGMYRAVLSNKRLLILADDAQGSSQTHALIPPPGSALLITSRNRFTLPGMVAFDLGPLPLDETSTLLLTICPRIGAQVRLLAALCGYLPLALRISAGVLVNDDTLRIDRYLERLESERLAHLRDPDVTDLDVESSLRLSFDRLDVGTQTVLCRLSVFPATFDLAAATAVVDVNVVEDALGRLRRHSLLEWDTVLERYNLHDLVRVFAAARLENGDSVQLRHAWYYAKIAVRAEHLYLQGGAQMLEGLALFDRERLHIDAGWAWSQARVGTLEADSLLIAYASATPYIDHLRYDPSCERIPRLNIALDAVQRQDDLQVEGTILGHLGNAYRAFGDIRRAIELFEQRLAIVQKLEDRRGEGSVLGNLGNAYRNLGDLNRATTLLEEALRIRREVGDRHAEANTLGSLASVYISLGDARQAIELNEQRLVIVREIEDRRGEAGVLGHLGEAYMSLGIPQRAITLLEDALHIAREMGDRRGEAEWLSHMGAAYLALGNTRQAMVCYEQNLIIVRAVGARSKEIAAMQKIIMLYEQQGDLEQATVLRQQFAE